ncbi:DUF2806 domain-containing protein [Desulfovibrio sp.]|uniref:DUF2806 domain-containing protein n=1 Tax=Desulfovibrio sp. TaxID=885 RepID=UPI003D0BC36B
MEIPEKTLTDVCALLVDNTCKGLGKLGSLIFGSQFRKKEYRDALMAAQAEKDAKAVAAGEARFDGTTLHPTLALPDMPTNVPLEYLPMLEGQRQERNNLNANLGIAVNILAKTPEEEVSDDPVSPDWFARWRREAQVIGDQELQNLWGRILAEEVKAPQSVSLNTLDVLKNISANDAESFSDIAKLKINHIIPAQLYKRTVSKNIAAILRLQNLGLLGWKDSLVSSLIETTDPCGEGFECCGFFLFFHFAADHKNIMTPPGYPISLAGQEILRIANSLSPPSPETIKTTGDYVWEMLSGNLTKMTAHPCSKNDFNDKITLKCWKK